MFDGYETKRNSHTERDGRKETAMNTMDCIDIKAKLSAIVDDQLDPAERHAAERHLVDCTECRTLIEEAERIDASIAREGELIAHGGLPDGFEAGVLTRTVYADQPRVIRPAWIAWSGWVAAAASLTLAVATVWIGSSAPTAQDEQFATTGSGMTSNPSPATSERTETSIAQPVSYTTGFDLRSQTYDGTFTPDVWRVSSTSPAYTSRSVAPVERNDAESDLSRLSLADTEALYTVSLLLDLLADPNLDIPVNIPQMQRAIESERLSERMGEIADQLEGRERRAILRAELVIHRLAAYEAHEGEPTRLREVIRESRLPDVISSIITRWDESSRL